MMFLTAAELRDLTGYQIAGWQIRWLRAHGWRFEISATGRPVVSRAHAEERMSGSQPAGGAVRLNIAAIQKRA